MDSATIFAIIAMITAVGMGSMMGSPSKSRKIIIYGGSVQHGGKHTRRHRRHKKN